LSEQDLTQKINEVDERDDVADGRKINKILTCPRC
jgi:hypothetical protein